MSVAAGPLCMASHSDVHIEGTVCIFSVYLSTLLYTFCLHVLQWRERTTGLSEATNGLPAFAYVWLTFCHLLCFWPKPGTWRSPVMVQGSITQLQGTAIHVVMVGDVIYFYNEEWSR